MDSGKTLALGSDGSVYVAGVTSSRNFPIINAIQSNYGGGKSDGFIFKLSPDGDDILFSSYWGGAKKDRINAIAIDNQDNLYLTGSTKSKDFPVLNGPQMKHQGHLDGFISKLSSDGQTLHYSSYLGGKKQDNAKAICIDSQQRAVITGSTRSKRNFPQYNSLQPKFAGGKHDAFVSRFTADGFTLDYSSFWGGKSNDVGTAIACDSQNRIIVAGYTRSKHKFPIQNAIQTRLDKDRDGFITRFNSTTTALDFSTYLGGEKQDAIKAIALDKSDNIFLTGYTWSDNFPVVDAIQTLRAGNRDAFITQLNEDGQQLNYSTFLGGSENDIGKAIAVDAAGAAYITGITRSDLDFPLVQPLQNIHQGKKEAFIVKLGGTGFLNTAPVITSIPITEAAENLFYQYQVIAEDADGDSVSYSLNNAPAGMQIDMHSGLIDWLPTQGGNAIVEIQVDDGQGGQTTQQFEIQIAKNQTPIFSSTPASTASKGKLYQVTLQATDSDNDSLNYQLLVYPPGMTIQTETGLIEWIPKAVGDYSVVVTVSDSRGASEKLAYSINVTSGSTNTVPPPLNPTEFTSLAAATAFLYSGNDPVQTGVTEGTIEEKRGAILRGKVLNNDNQPLTGVTIKIKDHPEFGQTLSHVGGIFNMAVNGGGLLTINYSKAGYLPVQRKVQTPWAEYAYAEDIIMIPLDEQATVIDLSDNSEAFQVAQGSVSTDVDGSRQATVLFPQGTTATMTLADGSTQALTSLTVRATEYTVGENGPKRMPGPLPPASGYTYAVELSVDEAIAADADKVTFNQKVPFYVDNFLDFPVGEVVPVGYYDKNKAVWIPSPNGKVIKVVSITDGIANLDVTGDDVVDTGITLTELGITQEEQIQLASLYSAGKSLWRVQIEHLTPWDCNWPFAPPNDAVPPLPEPEDTTPPDEDQDDCQGCSIQPQSQSLGEKLPIIGTPFKVHYQSKRMKGYTLSRSIDIPLTKADIPTSLQSIKLTIHVAGQHFIQTFLPEPNLSHRFIWDGKDAYGRALDQAQATVIIDYQYPLVYYSAPSGIDRAFAQATDKGSAGVIGKRGSQTVNIRRQWKRAVGSTPLLLDQASLGLWSLNIHHSYDRSTGILFQGDGMMRSGIDITKVISTLAGDGTNGFSGDGGPAIAGRLNFPAGITMGLDGSLYIADFYNSRIRKVGSDGIIITVAGNGDKSYSGDGGPATAASLYSPAGVTMGLDGSFYIADYGDSRIRKVGSDGIITTVAGNGAKSYSGDGGPATAAGLYSPSDVTMGLDGSLYIADTFNHRIRKVDPDGIITTVAGNVAKSYSGDGGPATSAGLNFPADVTMGPDGSLYIADHMNSRIRRVGSDGIITTVAGNDSHGFSGDGGPATAAGLNFPTGVTMGLDGSFYIADNSNARIRRVGSDGIITTVAGNGSYGFSGDGGPATAAGLDLPESVIMGPNGSIYIASDSNRIRRVANDLASIQDNEFVIPSSNADQLFYFSLTGHHLRTQDTLTGKVIYLFSYNSDGQLVEIEDIDGDITIIKRDTEGNPLAIVAPDGQRTGLTLDLNGYLGMLTDPAGQSWEMEYKLDGLMSAFTDRNNNRSEYGFETDGRLKSDINPIGGGWQLTRNDNGNSREISMTSGEGRISRFKVENLPDGTRRQTHSAADDTRTVSDFKEAVTTTILPNGTVTQSEEGPDPRFGMQAPLPKKTTLSVPSGLLSTITLTRNATLANLSDKLSLTQQTDTLTTNGKTSTSVYDATNKTISNTSAQGRTGNMLLNDKGRPIESQIAGLTPVNTQYDSRGRTKSITSGSGADLRETLYGYYETGPMKGYLETVTNALGQTSSFEYDLTGRITQQTLPDARIINYEYDANDNLTQLIPDGRPGHNFDYDGLDQETSYLPPSIFGVANPVTTYSYNKDRQLSQIIRPDGNTITPAYNQITGKLESLITPLGQTDYAYHANSGKLNKIITADNQQLDYSYDGFLPKTSEWTGDINGIISQNYNNDFNLISRSINGKHNIAYSYDNDQLLTQAGDLVLGREAQKGGLLKSTTLGLQTTAQSYTAFAELKNSSASYNGTEQINQNYIYDKLSRIKTKTETLGGISNTYEYNYDLSGRLKSVKKDNMTIETYGYDSNNNRTHKNGTQIAGYDDQDRLLTYNSNSYSYTDNGELESKTGNGATTHYSYDTLGNLRQVILPGDITIDYLIDGQNRRIGKKVNNQLKQGFLYKDQLNPIAELNENNEIVTRFVYAEKSHVPSYLIKIDPATLAETTYRVITDHLGSVRLVINVTDGNIAQRIDYDTWGRVIHDSNPGFQPFGFAGGLYDLHTQLVRFGARDYDAETGRWTAKDPIRFAGGDSNLFGYVLQNPVNFIDPNGQEATAVAMYSAFETGAVVSSAIGAAVMGVASALYPSPVGEGSDIVPPVNGMFNRPPGFWQGDTGSREWDRRNGTGRKGRDKFHGLKGRDKGPASGSRDSCSVNPDTGEVLDGNGENIGFLDE